MYSASPHFYFHVYRITTTFLGILQVTWRLAHRDRAQEFHSCYSRSPSTPSPRLPTTTAAYSDHTSETPTPTPAPTPVAVSSTLHQRPHVPNAVTLPVTPASYIRTDKPANSCFTLSRSLSAQVDQLPHVMSLGHRSQHMLPTAQLRHCETAVLCCRFAS